MKVVHTTVVNCFPAAGRPVSATVANCDTADEQSGIDGGRFGSSSRRNHRRIALPRKLLGRRSPPRPTPPALQRKKPVNKSQRVEIAGHGLLVIVT